MNGPGCIDGGAVNAERTNTNVQVPLTKRKKAVGTDVEESEHFVVPKNPGNALERTRRREGSAASFIRWRERWQGHRPLSPSQRNDDG